MAIPHDSMDGNSSEQQKNLVLWGYILQWASCIIPFLLIASPIYLWIVRGRVTLTKLQSHINWQLGTCYVAAIAVPIGFILLFVGFSGVNDDAPVSIIATFVLMAIAAIGPLWLLYRFIYGTVRFSKQMPMARLFP